MLLQACGGFPGSRSSLQGPPGGSRQLQGFPGGPPKALWARLKFHAGWSGWTRPPTMAGGGGSAQVEACCKGKQTP